MFLELFDQLEQVLAELVIAHAALESLDIGVLLQFAWLNVFKPYVVLSRPVRARRADIPRHAVAANGYRFASPLFSRPSLTISALSRSSAYIFLSCRFSVSSSLRRAISDAPIAPNLLRHLQNVVELMPWSRHSSGTGLPTSPCSRTAAISLSEKPDVFR